MHNNYFLSHFFFHFLRKFSRDFEERALKQNVERMFEDVTVWTTVKFDVSASATVMSGDAAPTDGGSYIQDFSREKSPQIDSLLQYFKKEVLDTSSKCTKFVFHALLDGVQPATVQNPAFGGIIRSYPELLCVSLDVLKAYVEINPSFKLSMLYKKNNVWNVLFSDEFISPCHNKRINIFLRQKIIDFVSSSVNNPAWEESRVVLLTRLYVLFSVTTDPEHHIVYIEIIASIVSRYVPSNITDVVMLLQILPLSLAVESPALAPRFTLAKSSIMHALVNKLHIHNT